MSADAALKSTRNKSSVVSRKQQEMVDGREVVNACFDAALARDPRVFAFGEDIGNIGDVSR